jgi:hypothetical protein
MRGSAGCGLLLGQVPVAVFVLTWLSVGALAASAGADSEDQTASLVPEYAAFVRALPPDPASVVRARDELVARYAASSVDSAEAAFRVFWAFHTRTLRASLVLTPATDKLLERICPGARYCPDKTIQAFRDRPAAPAPGGKPGAARPQGIEALHAYRAAGFVFRSSEGMWYLAPDAAFLSAVAAQLPLGELADWVRFWAAEEPQLITEDAGLMVSWEAVRKRIGRWETFARLHPSLPERREEIEPHARALVALYLFGVDNTPAYDADYQVRPLRFQIVPELLESYERFLRENRGSVFHGAILAVVGQLTATRGQLTPEVIAVLRGRLTDPYFTNWIRRLERRLQQQPPPGAA